MLTALGSAISALADVDVDALSDRELHQLVTGLHEVDARLAAVRARATARWTARTCWASDGSKAPAARLTKDCKLAPATARRELRRARRLATMPLTAEALAAGTLSVDHVDELVTANRPEVAHLFRRDEAVLVDKAHHEVYDTFHRTVRYWTQRADDHHCEQRAERQYGGRHFAANVTFQSTVDLRGVVDPINGGIFRTEFQRLEQALFEADWAAARAQHGKNALPEHLARTAAQRRADALVEMAKRSAAMDPEATFTRPLVTVLVGWETLNGRICQLADGTVVTPNQMLSLVTEADVERIVFDTGNRVIEVGRRERFFTGALRRAIEVRDQHCQHSGCTVPAEYCQVDHVIPFCQGGDTTQENGELECPGHNRKKGGGTRRRPRGR